MMASTEEEFQNAARYIQNLPSEGPYKLTSADKLTFYALNKQATIGRCNTRKPGFFNFSGKAKWNKWMQLGEMSKENAMLRYIEEYRRVKAAYERAQAAAH